MTPELWFSIANPFALAGWALLVFAIVTQRPWVRDVIVGRAWPVALSVGYVAALAAGWGTTEGGFSSLPAMRALFSNDWALLAGWVHYLAFDLFVGAWIAGEVEKTMLSRLVLVPVLPLVFLFGPTGLLLFVILRATLGKEARS